VLIVVISARLVGWAGKGKTTGVSSDESRSLHLVLHRRRFPRSLHRTLELLASPYGVFLADPSATGDIEGVIIHGAQGARSLTVLLLDRFEGLSKAFS
jgi:hypothetical protein